MRKGVFAIAISSLMLLSILTVCSTANAEGFAHIIGRVSFKGVGVIGATVTAVGGFSEVQVKTKIMGFYFIHLPLKRVPTDIKITASTNFDEPASKTIQHSSGGYYWMAFKF